MKVTIEIEVDDRVVDGMFAAGEIALAKYEAIPLKHYVETSYISILGPEGISFSPDIGVRVNIRD